MSDSDLNQLTSIVTSVITDHNVSQVVGSIQLIKQRIAELQSELTELEASLPSIVAEAINPSAKDSTESKS
ncbi:MAG: hypothetical protein WC346_10810 [Methanogenium sp.]|jgi:hypothetical protein